MYQMLLLFVFHVLFFFTPRFGWRTDPCVLEPTKTYFEDFSSQCNASTAFAELRFISPKKSALVRFWSDFFRAGNGVPWPSRATRRRLLPSSPPPSSPCESRGDLPRAKYDAVRGARDRCTVAVAGTRLGSSSWTKRTQLTTNTHTRAQRPSRGAKYSGAE